MERVSDLWHEIMPLQGAPSLDDILLERKVDLVEGGPNPELVDEVMLKRNRISRIYFLKKFFDYPISMKMRTIIPIGIFTLHYHTMGMQITIWILIQLLYLKKQKKKK